MQRHLDRTARRNVEESVARSETAYRRQAEYEAHEATWMIWPHRGDLYGQRLAAMQQEHAAIVGAIAEFEPVHVVAHPDHVDTARLKIGNKARIVALPVDDFWARDCGPTFLTGANGEVAGVSWHFNAWGEKFSPWTEDDKLARRILDLQGLIVRESWLTCEGGSLACDGDGTLIVTETSILNPNRNPGVNKALAESELKAMLGVGKVVWLPGDPMDKATDGHIDGMCCFVRPGTVFFEVNQDPSDPHSRILKENLACLRAQTDARGRAFQIIPLNEAIDAEVTSDMFCRSYINFYLANGGVIVPGYGTSGDLAARDAVAAAFPDRKVVQVQVNAIAAGGGAIHCITQERPAPASGI